MPPTPGQPTDFDEREARFHRDAVNELVSLGMAFARNLTRESANNADRATAAYRSDIPAGSTSPELAAAFERVGRTVRRSVLLARHLAKPETPPRKPRDPHPPGSHPPGSHSLGADRTTRPHPGPGAEGAAPSVERFREAGSLRDDMAECLADPRDEALEPDGDLPVPGTIPGTTPGTTPGTPPEPTPETIAGTVAKILPRIRPVPGRDPSPAFPPPPSPGTPPVAGPDGNVRPGPELSPSARPAETVPGRPAEPGAPASAAPAAAAPAAAPPNQVPFPDT